MSSEYIKGVKNYFSNTSIVDELVYPASPKETPQTEKFTNFETGKLYTGQVNTDTKVITFTETPGIKNDQDKPSMSSIPTEAMWQMGKALGYGAKKYGDNNYRQGMKVSRQLAAAVRHIYQHLGGQDIDEESGNTHIGHALASLAMAAYTLANHPEMDDRYQPDKDKFKKENT